MSITNAIDRARQLVDLALDEAAGVIIADIDQVAGLKEAVRIRLAVGNAKSGTIVGPTYAVSVIEPAGNRPPPARQHRANKGSKYEVMRAWWAKTLAPALKHPEGSRERTAATRKLLDATHALPDGTKKKFSPASIYLQIKNASKRGGRAKATKPAKAASKAEADDEPALAIVGNYLGAQSTKRTPAVPLNRERERDELQRAGTIGNPLVLSKDFEGDAERKSSCPAYNRCLGFIVKHSKTKAGDNWTCRGCEGPGLQRQRGTARTA